MDNNTNPNKAVAADFGLHPDIAIIPDTMVAVAQYASRLRVEAIYQLQVTGEMVPFDAICARIAYELGLMDPDGRGIENARGIIHSGESIIWDRELRNLDDHEREEALLPYLNPEEAWNRMSDDEKRLADELSEELSGVMDEAFRHAAQMREDREILDRLWEA